MQVVLVLLGVYVFFLGLAEFCRRFYALLRRIFRRGDL